MHKHLNLIIRGTVQGVFYRASAQEQATALGLTGFVRNESNGDVYMEVEGPDTRLQQFIDWCWQGPRRANVTDIVITEGPLQSFASFGIDR
jgi:acylphosphatase